MVLEIPLKSKPKVSMTTAIHGPTIAGTPSGWTASRSRSPRTSVSSQIVGEVSREEGNNYKLARAYSETETNNFDSDTGHRLFDDGKIRSKPSRACSPTQGDSCSVSRNCSRTKLFRSQTSEAGVGEFTENFAARYGQYSGQGMGQGFGQSVLKNHFMGLEDEYIPGLNFSDVIHDWDKPSTDQSAATSRDVSYLDLKQLHAKVSPQPINQAFAKNLFSLDAEHEADNDPLQRKKSSAGSSGQVSFEAVLAGLPPNFNDLPYSQRKKMVKDFSDTIDYPQFSQFAKSFMSNSFGSGGRSLTSGPNSFIRNGSFIRRSRRNSMNTVAGRLLALSSSSDLKKLDNTPKKNVDEKGAYVMNHQLGKVIGFGAWGIIRECTNKAGTVRAIKIVKSTKVDEAPATATATSGTASPRTATSGTATPDSCHNPKVLQVFRKEIEIWKQLNHPNILPLLESLETDNIIFCLTNCVSGGTLFDMVSRWGHFDEGVNSTSGTIRYSVKSQRKRLVSTVKCASQIVEAMSYMHHDLGIVHGDLKLENVLVEADDSNNHKLILCDFGMSRVYNPRVSRSSSGNASTLSSRSKSSYATVRRPYQVHDAPHSRPLFSDDSKIGISQLYRQSGLCSVSLSASHSVANIPSFHDSALQKPSHSEIDSGLPHSHIGSLPYASPELLSHSPPPLGPSADIWAFGILLYTMCVGRLPFQHPYEPRLRAMITAGKFNKAELKQSTLMESVLGEMEDMASSLIDMTRKEELKKIEKDWLSHDPNEFEWLTRLIKGCIERDITKRWDLSMIHSALSLHV